MNSQADKRQENKSQSVKNENSQKQFGRKTTFQFVDNRPTANAQSKLQELANNSQKVSQLRSFQEKANKGQQVRQTAQLQSKNTNHSNQQQPIQKKGNHTGLPDNLKTGIEQLSGMSMDDVKVHRNSDKPAQLNAHAYAQGTNIHLGTGQEKHLPHEAWHVVQQKQGRVKPTMLMKGKVNINDDVGLEKEADVMGAKAVSGPHNHVIAQRKAINAEVDNDVAQRIKITEENTSKEVFAFYQTLQPEAKFFITQAKQLDDFLFGMSPKMQIMYLHLLNQSLPTLNNLIKQSAGVLAIKGPEHMSQNQLSVHQLQFAFGMLNPDFALNFLNLVQNRAATFNFAAGSGQHVNTITITSLSALREYKPQLAITAAPKGDAEGFLRDTMQKILLEKDLKKFMQAQHRFQNVMKSMDGLNSVGFEYEFASFSRPGMGYTADEIIPSHQLMATSQFLGRYFGLSWRLESDAKNTLELVTPPFVFPRTDEGAIKRDEIHEELLKTTDNVGHKAGQTLTTLAKSLGGLGLGTGWVVGGHYQDFEIVKNQKSGGSVLGQMNISLFPKEIGALVLERFKTHNSGREPEDIAREILRILNHSAKEKPTEPVEQALAIFARYASNVLGIPSLLHRQATGIRKDPMATEIKESLGIWIKTDPLNLLKHILTSTEDRLLFEGILGEASGSIKGLINKIGTSWVKRSMPPPSMSAKPMGGFNLVETVKRLKTEHPDWKGPQIMQAAKLLEKQHEEAPQVPQVAVEEPGVALIKRNTKMMELELAKFIQRSLSIETHEETNPETTTADFLGEKFGSGKGVRKGTHLKGIPTTHGPMYVSEIR